HLVKEIGKPGIPIEGVFKAVRASVRVDSKNQQIPWESTSLESYFAFRAPPPAPKPAAAPPSAAANASAPRSVSSPTAPPVFAKGDKWTYRVVNVIDNSERKIEMSVKDV